MGSRFPSRLDTWRDRQAVEDGAHKGTARGSCLGGGRELAYTDIGHPAGPCVFFVHGAPMSRLHLLSIEAELAAQGLRVVSPDRPGYGRSAPQPGRSLADWPADVAALADALGIGRFLVAGHSSGGPYAVASAARLGERVLGGVVMGGVTDMAWPGAWSDYLGGRKELEIMRAPDERAALASCAEHFGADGSGFFTERFELPEPDTVLLADEAAEQALTAALTEAFRQDIAGYAQDIYLEGRGWCFDPSRIAAPVFGDTCFERDRPLRLPPNPPILALRYAP